MISITCHPFLLGEELKELGRKKRNKQLLRVGCQKRKKGETEWWRGRGKAGLLDRIVQIFNQNDRYFGENRPLYIVINY